MIRFRYGRYWRGRYVAEDELVEDASPRHEKRMVEAGQAYYVTDREEVPEGQKDKDEDMPTMENKSSEIRAYAKSHSIDVNKSDTKKKMLEKIYDSHGH